MLSFCSSLSKNLKKNKQKTSEAPWLMTSALFYLTRGFCIRFILILGILTQANVKIQPGGHNLEKHHLTWMENV